MAAILLPRVWAYLTSALAFVLYGTVLELCYFEIVPSYSVTRPGIRTLQGIIFVNLFGYLAIAYLAGLLASKLRLADRRLEYTRGELLSLQALHENIIRSTSSGLITTGLDGRIIFWNMSAEKLVERLRRTCWEKIAPLFQDHLPQAGSEHSHGEVRFARPTVSQDLPCWFRVDGARPRTLGHVHADDLTQIRRLSAVRAGPVGKVVISRHRSEVRNPLTSTAPPVCLQRCLTSVTSIGACCRL